MQTKVITRPNNIPSTDIIKLIEAIISRYIYSDTLDKRDAMVYNEPTYYHWLSERE